MICCAGLGGIDSVTQHRLALAFTHTHQVCVLYCVLQCVFQCPCPVTQHDLALAFIESFSLRLHFLRWKKLLCCISIPSTLFCAHLHFAAPPTLLGLLSCAKTASVCCCISTFYYDTWFFYYNSWMVSRIHLHLINIPHSTNPNIKDVSVKCAMPLQLIYILKSPQILHNSLKFTTANLVPEKTSNEIHWLCSVTLHLCFCAQWNIWLYSYDINKRSL